MLFEIDYSGGQQCFHLNSKDLSSYPEEQEVLLQEGIMYKVLKISEEKVPYSINGSNCLKNLTIISLKNIKEKYSNLSFFERFYNIMFK